MNPEIDIDAYFRRIGYSGTHHPSLETLRSILIRHTETIPFENLDPLLRVPVLLDPASLERKLVHEGRGGYCFEQNLLLGYVLRTLGFEVTDLAARVLWEHPEDAVMPRTHMLLRLEVDARTYIADVGFGVLTVTGPLRLESETVQDTPHESYRLLHKNESFVLQVQINGSWKALYSFDLQEQCLPDYEITNWYLSNHPDSKFVTGLIAARPSPDRRHTLHDNEHTVRHLKGRTERRRITSADELRATLRDTFLISLPDTPGLDAVLEGVSSKAS